MGDACFFVVLPGRHRPTYTVYLKTKIRVDLKNRLKVEVVDGLPYLIHIASSYKVATISRVNMKYPWKKSFFFCKYPKIKINTLSGARFWKTPLRVSRTFLSPRFWRESFVQLTPRKSVKISKSKNMKCAYFQSIFKNCSIACLQNRIVSSVNYYDFAIEISENINNKHTLLVERIEYDFHKYLFLKNSWISPFLRILYSCRQPQ